MIRFINYNFYTVQDMNYYATIVRFGTGKYTIIIIIVIK